MNEPQPNSPRRRLQELLAIPERQRTEAQWDEINELEISLTPVNREVVPERGVRRDATAPATNRPKPNGGGQGKKPFKRHHKRPPKERVP